jgi:hypothetical protein
MLRPFLAVAALAATTAPCDAIAQEASPGGQKLMVVTYRVLPADASRLEGLGEKVVAAAREINLDAGYGWWYWNNVFDYTLVYPFENMAYWDDPEQWARQFQGTAAEEKANKLFGEFATISLQVTANEILETVPSWSYLLADAESSVQPAFIEISDISIKSGKEMEWDALAQEFAALLAEIEYPYPTIGYRVMFGGAGRMIYVTLYDSREAFFGSNALDRLIEAKGQTATWSDMMDRYVAMAVQQEVHHGVAKPNMGYRVVP